LNVDRDVGDDARQPVNRELAAGHVKIAVDVGRPNAPDELHRPGQLPGGTLDLGNDADEQP